MAFLSEHPEVAVVIHPHPQRDLLLQRTHGGSGAHPPSSAAAHQAPGSGADVGGSKPTVDTRPAAAKAKTTRPKKKARWEGIW